VCKSCGQCCPWVTFDHLTKWPYLGPALAKTAQMVKLPKRPKFVRRSSFRDKGRPAGKPVKQAYKQSPVRVCACPLIISWYNIPVGTRARVPACVGMSLGAGWPIGRAAGSLWPKVAPAAKNGQKRFASGCGSRAGRQASAILR